MNTKLVWTPWGNNLAIGIYARTRTQAERIFNGCYNYGAVSIYSQLHTLKDDKKGYFGYFKSTWKDLQKIKNIPYIESLLPKTQKQIDKAREDFLTRGELQELQ